ncbi:MAG: DUF445 family protein [Lentisphaeraceae bacterium]|nr:DUF445 family protein [Lentisphaeraceae bacterium]
MTSEYIIFPLIGSIIGAFTNELAIRMLFRPYNAWYIGKMKVPMTPGVIPAQREQIAKNIAETFEKHLLSSGEIHSAITSENSKRIINEKIDEAIKSLGPLAIMAAPFKPKITEKLIAGIDAVAEQAISNGDLDIRKKIEDKINAMPVATLEELILGFSRKQFKHITIFGGILGALIGLVQAGISQFL